MNAPRSLRILRRWLLMSFDQQVYYRTSFILAVIAKIARALILLAFFGIIFLKVPTIGDWTKESVLVLITVFMSFESLMVITFHRNLAYYLPDHLRKGTFDSFLVQPIRPLVSVGFRIIDVMDAISTIPVIVLWCYIFSRGIIHPGAASIAMFICACACGAAFTFSLSTLIAAASFWTLVPTGLGRLYEQVYRVGRYPVDALGTVQGTLFTMVIPVAFVGTVPAQALLGILSWRTLVLSLIPLSIIAFIARYAWMKGLRRYSSASS